MFSRSQFGLFQPYPCHSRQLASLGPEWLWALQNLVSCKISWCSAQIPNINYLAIKLSTSVIITWSHSWHSLGSCPHQNQGWDVEHCFLSLLFPYKICIWLLHAWAWNDIQQQNYITSWYNTWIPAENVLHYQKYCNSLLYRLTTFGCGT